MRIKLTLEEKTTRALAKKLERQTAKKLEREAANAARIAQWAAEDALKRDSFLSSMSEQDRSDFQAAISMPSTVVCNEHGDVRVTNDFLFSLQNQFNSRGFLSDKQRDILIDKGRKTRLQAEAATNWPNVAENERVEILCKAFFIERVADNWGSSYRIKLKSHYGRTFIVKTGKEDYAELARASIEQGTRINVEGKVKWVAPDAGGPVVLTSRGMYFKKL